MASGYPRRAARSASRMAKLARSSPPATPGTTTLGSATPHRDQRQGEGTGLHAAEINCGVTESGVEHNPADLAAQRLADGPDQVLRRQFDPGDVAVVPHPQVGKSQQVQPRL